MSFGKQPFSIADFSLVLLVTITAFQTSVSAPDSVLVSSRNSLSDEKSNEGILHLEEGMKFLQIDKYDSALYHLLDAIRIAERDNERPLLANAYSALGKLYYRLGDPDRALGYYTTADSLISGMNNHTIAPNLHIDKGLALVDLGNIESALDCFDKVSSDCQSHCDENIVMRTYYARGIAWLKKGEIQKVLTDLNVALAIARNLQDRRSEAGILVRLSAAQIEMGNYRMADEFLSDAETLATGFEQSVLAEVYRQKILVASHFGKLKEQTDYQAKLIVLSESLYNEQIMAKLAELEINFEERDNLELIEQQQLALELSAETMAKKKRLIILGVICVVLGMIVAIMLVRAVRRKRIAVKSLVNEVEASTEKLELLISEEQKEIVTRQLESKAMLRRMKADVATLLGVCIVVSKHSADEQTLEKFGAIQRELVELKRRLEGF